MIPAMCSGGHMLSKVFSIAIITTILSVTEVAAQSLAQLGGPSNPPPAGFTGQQFVDARGCVFLRAGYGKTINWVPRIDRNRKPLCGFPPTFGAEAAAAVEADMAPDPAAHAAPASAAPAQIAPTPFVAAAPSAPSAPLVVASNPRPTVVAPVFVARPVTAQAAPSPAPAPKVYTSKPVAVAAAPQPTRPSGFGFGLFAGLTGRPAAPQGVTVPPDATVIVAAANPNPLYQPATGAAAAGGDTRCFHSAPMLERVQLRNGGSALVCTRGDGTTDGWRPPIFVQNNGVGVALSNPPLTPQTMAGAVVVYNGYAPQQPAGQVAYANPAPVVVIVPQTGATRVASSAVPKPPPGYKLAWKDGRLNPLRGVGTPQGQAAQDQIWTRTVPAVLVATAPQKPAVRVLGVSINLSTMSAPQTNAAPVRIAANPSPATGGALFVQVGTFGQPSNATGAKARLAALGLPVSTSAITRKGKDLQIVYAGPFATASAAQVALQSIHGAGFADAILR